MELLVAQVLSLLSPLAALVVDAPKSEPANFTTTDGVEIVGDQIVEFLGKHLRGSSDASP